MKTAHQVIVRRAKPADDKLAPQAKQIVELVPEAGIDRKQLLGQLGHRLKTKQPPGRVFSFYKQFLVKRGYIKLAKVKIEPTAPAPTGSLTPATATA